MDINEIPAQTGKFLSRYNLVLFIIIVVGSMSAIIFVVNGILQESTDTSTIQQPTAEQFDQKTIDRVNSLKPAGDQSDLSISPGQRINPFVE